MKRCFKLLLTFVIVFSLFIKVDASLTKSKSASKLDKDYNTKITLNLNDKPKEVITKDIVIVFDVGSLGNFGDSFKEEVYNFINSLKSDATLKAYVSMVGYGAGSEVIFPLTEAKDITGVDYISSKIAEHNSFISASGDRDIIEAGIKSAKNILDNSSTGSDKSNRHVILFTDEAPYNYLNADGKPSVAVYKQTATLYSNMNNMDSNGDVVSVNRENKLIKYLGENNNDYKKAFAKLFEEYDAVHALSQKGNEYDSLDPATVEAKKAAGKIIVYDNTVNYNSLDEYPYTTIEIGTVEAAKALTDVKEEGYNIYTIGYRYMWGYQDDGVHFYYPNLAHVSYAFEMWTKTVGENYIFTKKTLTSEDINSSLSSIKTAMNKTVEKNSYLVDEMDFGKLKDGTDYNFDLVNDLNKMDIAINGTKLDKVKIANNKYGFGKIDDTNYKVVLSYFPEGETGVSSNESIKIDINTTVEPGIPITVNYSEVLKVGNSNDYRKYSFADDESDESMSNTTLHLNNGTSEDFNRLVLVYNASLNIPDTLMNAGIFTILLIVAVIISIVAGVIVLIKKHMNKVD